MIIHALTHCSASERSALCEFLGRSRTERSQSEVIWVRSLLRSTGSIREAQEFARSLAGSALYEFDACFDSVSPGRDLAFIRNLISWVMQRGH